MILYIFYGAWGWKVSPWNVISDMLHFRSISRNTYVSIFKKMLWQCDCVARNIIETVFLIVKLCLRLKNFALYFSSNIGA